MKRTMLAGLIWLLGVTAQAANTVQVDVTGTKTWDPLFPSVSGSPFTDGGRTGTGLDVLTHGPAGGSTVIVAGGVNVASGTSFRGSGVAPAVSVPGGVATASGSAFTGSSTPPGVSVPAGVDVASGTSFKGSGVAPSVAVPAGVDVASGTSFKGSGVAPKVEVTNTISQGDVNNASKAANMSVTDYADSASGSAGHAVAMFDVGAVQTTSSTRFTVAAAGAETTFVFPRGTNWIEVRAGLASSTTEAFFVNSAAGFAKIQTGSEVGAGVDAAPYREPNLNLPVTGGTRYLSSRWGTFPISVTYGQVQ